MPICWRSSLGLSMREAAALPLITITAWKAWLIAPRCTPARRCSFMPGQVVSAMLPCRSHERLALRCLRRCPPRSSRIVEDFGATAIDYRRSSVEEYVAATTDGLGFDIVYDTVGG